jgi:hypothetical protein
MGRLFAHSMGTWMVSLIRPWVNGTSVAYGAVAILHLPEAKIVSVNCGQSIDGLESAGSTLSTRLRKPQRT